MSPPEIQHGIAGFYTHVVRSFSQRKKGRMYVSDCKVLQCHSVHNNLRTLRMFLAYHLNPTTGNLKTGVFPSTGDLCPDPQTRFSM
jgi:hypothetical protein